LFCVSATEADAADTGLFVFGGAVSASRQLDHYCWIRRRGEGAFHSQVTQITHLLAIVFLN